MAAVWSNVKRLAGGAERSLDEAVHRFVRIELDRNDPEFVSDTEVALEAEIEAALRNLAEAIDKLVACPSADKPPTSHAQIQRFREILFDQKTKFRTAQNRLRQMRESETLRKLMQRDVRGQAGDDAAQETLMRERSSIANASRVAGETINQALEAHSELVSQRRLFTGTTGRLVDIGRQVPGLDSLIKRIEDKRTRDNTILALVIAFCTCFMLWYWLSGWGI